MISICFEMFKLINYKHMVVFFNKKLQFSMRTSKKIYSVKNYFEIELVLKLSKFSEVIPEKKEKQM